MPVSAFLHSSKLIEISSCRTFILAVFMLLCDFNIYIIINELIKYMPVYCSSVFLCLCYYASNFV